jgi:hypothetical protein
MKLYLVTLPTHTILTSLFFTHTQFLLEARKIKLLSELQTIYPVERLDNGEFAIRGIEVPTDLK